MVIDIHPQLIADIHKSKHIVVSTGAGASAESGVPTFREANTGLWAKYRPEELATPQAFLADPRRGWEWYQWRRKKIKAVQPNPGHFALAELETQLNIQKISFTLITQNIDGLHQRAGSQNIIELHGNISRTKCFDCKVIIEHWTETQDPPPRCDKCGGLLRPDVVWFGEMLNNEIVQKSLDRLRSTEILIIAGTSGVVYPVAEFPFFAKQQNPSVAIYEFNLEYTPISQITKQTILGPVEVTLPEFLNKSL